MDSYHSIQFFTDGATRGNPGPGGYGVVMINTMTHEVYEYGDSKDPTTNNEMELAAIVRAVQAAQERNIKSFTLFTDSQYAHNGITQWRFGWVKRGWKNKNDQLIKNINLWQELSRLLDSTGFIDIQWVHVPGHMGIAGNERADTIATAFADRIDISLRSGHISQEQWEHISQVPTLQEIEIIRQKKKSHAKGITCWYVSLVDGVVQDHQTWAECKERVEGSYAKYKKVCSQEERQEVIQSWGVD